MPPVTAVPTATVFVVGLNALFVTEISPTAGGVLPGGCVFGPVDGVPPPLPPQALAEISAKAIQTFLVFMAFSPL